MEGTRESLKLHGTEKQIQQQQWHQKKTAIKKTFTNKRKLFLCNLNNLHTPAME